MDVSRPINADMKGVALAWAEGDELGEIAQRSRIAEGDLVGLLQKTLDILGQLRAAVDGVSMPAPRADRIDRTDLLERLNVADDLIRRGVVEESYRWAVSGPPDPFISRLTIAAARRPGSIAERSSQTSSVEPPPMSKTSSCDAWGDTSGAQEITASRASSSGRITSSRSPVCRAASARSWSSATG